MPLLKIVVIAARTPPMGLYLCGRSVLLESVGVGRSSVLSVAHCSGGVLFSSSVSVHTQHTMERSAPIYVFCKLSNPV